MRPRVSPDSYGPDVRFKSGWVKGYGASIVRELRMRRISTLLFLLALSAAVPLADALAQSGAGRGAVSGAIIGGAVGGPRGAAIGAATGAAVGSHRRRHWRSPYYWRHGRCWVRTSSGRSHPVSHRYCR